MWKKIYNEAFMEKQNEKISLKNIKKRMFNLKSKINYLYVDNNIIGFSMVFNIINNIWHIDYLAIDPKYQSKGYGKLLIKDLIKKYKNLSLECNDKLITYYNKFNFNKHQINYYYDNHKFNIMTNYKSNYDDIKLLINKLNNYNLLTLMTYILIILFIYNNDLKFIRYKNITNNYYKHEIF